MAEELQIKTGLGENWWASIKHDGREVPVFMDKPHGELDPAQQKNAERLASHLEEVAQQAQRYLDLFVDRQKAGGNGDEPWWLDEIDMRPSPCSATPSCSLSFSLFNDDGGLWTVEFHIHEREFRPFRLERLQG